jgi:hypothetical protein
MKSHDDDLRRIFKLFENKDQAVTQTIIGEENTDIQHGNTIITKARIFDGNSNRLANAFDYYVMRGCDAKIIGQLRATVFGASIGYCKDIPDYGMRGEALEIIRPVQRKEQPQQMPNQNIDNNQKQNNQPGENQN